MSEPPDFKCDKPDCFNRVGIGIYCASCRGKEECPTKGCGEECEAGALCRKCLRDDDRREDAERVRHASEWITELSDSGFAWRVRRSAVLALSVEHRGGEALTVVWYGPGCRFTSKLYIDDFVKHWGFE